MIFPYWAREDQRWTNLISQRCTTVDEVAWWVKAVHDGQHKQGGQNGRGASSTRSTYPEIAANAALALIAVAYSLFDRQIAAQSRSFEKEGGFTERMYRVRTFRRKS